MQVIIVRQVRNTREGAMLTHHSEYTVEPLLEHPCDRTDTLAADHSEADLGRDKPNA
jgi:hypothetical protein